MVHYIRFLRTPQVSLLTKKGFNITAVVAIATDLGDTLLGSPVMIVCRLLDAHNSQTVVQTQSIQWKDGMRAAKINVQCTAKDAGRLIQMHVTTEETTALLAIQEVPCIMDAWSKTFLLKDGMKSQNLVERQISLPGRCTTRILEETGESIARHVWDASLGFLILFRQIFSDSRANQLGSLSEFLTAQPTKSIRTLEVGAGCGLVGIALAQLRKIDINLTDLEEAQALLQTNIEKAIPLAGSVLSNQVLGWGSDIDSLQNAKYDLALVSDCIYNPDSSCLLVQLLESLCRVNAKLLVLVGFKRRHDADDIFFERMTMANFLVVESCTILLPHTMTEYDVEMPKVEFFLYRRQQQCS